MKGLVVIFQLSCYFIQAATRSDRVFTDNKSSSRRQRRLKLNDNDPIFEHQRNLNDDECATTWDCICDGDSGLGTETVISLNHPGEGVHTTDTSNSYSSDSHSHSDSESHTSTSTSSSSSLDYNHNDDYDDGHNQNYEASFVNYAINGLYDLTCGVGECDLSIHGGCCISIFISIAQFYEFTLLIIGISFFVLFIVY